MSDGDNPSHSYPEGIRFFELAAYQTRKSVGVIDAWLVSTDGIIGLYSELGTLLSLLYRGSICYWGCRHQDHFEERLVGRVVNTAMGAMALLRSGYYDESLNLTRSVTELSNLFALFANDPSDRNQWKAADRDTRLNEFGPALVRRKLEKKGVTAFITRDRYASLCEIATHPQPSTNPQAYSPDGLPRIGGQLQAIGAELALNELAIAVSLASFYVAQLLGLTEAIADRIQKLAAGTIGLISDIQVTNMEHVWDRVSRAETNMHNPDDDAKV